MSCSDHWHILSRGNGSLLTRGHRMRFAWSVPRQRHLRTVAPGFSRNGVNLARFGRERSPWSDRLLWRDPSEDSEKDPSFLRGGSDDSAAREFVLRRLQQRADDGISGSHQRGEKETISGSLRMMTRTAWMNEISVGAMRRSRAASSITQRTP